MRLYNYMIYKHPLDNAIPSTGLDLFCPFTTTCVPSIATLPPPFKFQTPHPPSTAENGYAKAVQGIIFL